MRLVFLLVVWCVVSACGASARTGAGGGSTDGSMFVVTGSQLGANLLQGLSSRVPGMSVVGRAGECPLIVFRGQRSARAQGNPAVYIDGTRVGDTCMLLQIAPSEVDYVEVYPSGNTHRTGIRPDPFGLILVFRQRG